MFQSELARSGKFLFQIRGHYIRVLILIGIGIAWLVGKPGPFDDHAANLVWFVAGLTLAMAGALWRVYVNGYAAYGTSGRVKTEAVAAELNTTGAYSLVRNPLYVGRILNFTGLAMLTGSAFYGAVIYLVSVLVYERISAYEEEFLVTKFGDEHTRWAKEVPALMPRFHGYVPPKYKFWPRRVFWREYKKFYQLGTALFFYTWAWHGFSLEWMLAHPALYWSYAILTVVRVGIFGMKLGGFFKDLQ